MLLRETDVAPDVLNLAAGAGDIVMVQVSECLSE